MKPYFNSFQFFAPSITIQPVFINFVLDERSTALKTQQRLSGGRRRKILIVN